MYSPDSYTRIDQAIHVTRSGPAVGHTTGTERALRDEGGGIGVQSGAQDTADKGFVADIEDTGGLSCAGDGFCCSIPLTRYLPDT